MPNTNPIEERIRALSMSEGERNIAIGYVRCGEEVADLIMAVVRLFCPVPMPVQPAH